MKKMVRIMLPLISIFILAFAFLLPQLIFNIQMKVDENTEKSYEIEGISFETSNKGNFLDAIDVFENSYKGFTVDDGENYSYSTILENIGEKLKILTESGAIKKDLMDSIDMENMDLKPTLSYMIDESKSAIIWQCSMEGQPSLSMQIDDSSGNIILFSLSGIPEAITDINMWKNVLTDMYSLTGIKNISYVEYDTRDTVYQVYECYTGQLDAPFYIEIYFSYGSDEGEFYNGITIMTRLETDSGSTIDDNTTDTITN